MNSVALLVAAAALGVDYGWQYDNNGKLEYLIQVEPALLRSMENGLPVTSEIEPQVRGVRRFRILVGNGPLPREAIRPQPAEQPASAQVPISPGGNTGALGPPKLPAENRRPDAFAKPGPATTNGEPKRLAGDADRGSERDSDRPDDTGTAQDAGPFEQAAARPIDSPSDARGDNAGGSPTTATADAPLTSSPWFVGAVVALCASLGVNFYQGWNLKSARRRYYQLVDRLGLRSMPGSDGVTIVS